MQRIRTILFFIIAVVLTPACSTFGALDAGVEIEKPAPIQTGQANDSGASNKWWVVGFFMDWPEESETAWYMDHYLAHKIVKPVLQQHKQHFELWRFHRRAARDATGHKFSFAFYATDDVARDVFAAIRDDKQLATVNTFGLIKRIEYTDPGDNNKLGIKDTSDPNWSPPVQKSWPYFIMGVSDMWLHLIDEIAVRDIGGFEINNYQDILNFYKHVEEEVTNTWRNEGGHAYLHHLNALFGYRETIVVERRYMRF